MVQRRNTKNKTPNVVESPVKQEIDGMGFVRLVNNFYSSINYPADYSRIGIDLQLSNYVASHQADVHKKYKVAMIFICLNPLYWEYAKKMVQGARALFLPGHQTDFLFWTDMPETVEEVGQKVVQAFADRGANIQDPKVVEHLNSVITGVVELRGQKDIQVFPTEAIEWPFPTLLRYNLFLQQEEKLKEYDYIFYCDIDMQFINVVGDEILGDGITAAQHPMYAHRKEYWPPYEPNKTSQAYIPRPGKVIDDNGKPRFMPLYYAGGFQGGKSDVWIKAMKEMRMMTDKDLTQNYIPIWNDESIFNAYLFKNEPAVVLTPSYIYPDSLIKEYYEPLWGCSYVPKLMTLTKWFTLSKDGGEHVAKMLDSNRPK